MNNEIGTTNLQHQKVNRNTQMYRIYYRSTLSFRLFTIFNHTIKMQYKHIERINN